MNNDSSIVEYILALHQSSAKKKKRKRKRKIIDYKLSKGFILSPSLHFHLCFYSWTTPDNIKYE